MGNTFRRKGFSNVPFDARDLRYFQNRIVRSRTDKQSLALAPCVRRVALRRAPFAADGDDERVYRVRTSWS